MSISKYVALLRLGFLEPRLMLLALQIKKSQKTFLTYPKLLNFLYCFRLLSNRNQRPLQLAEFGVGRGGSAIFLAWLVGKYGGTLTLFDLFGRIPAPTEKDGERAQNRYQNILHQEGSDYYGNITDLVEVILEEIKTVCDINQIRIVQGRYEETLPKLMDQQYFDLVHIDCDWYESLKAVLAYVRNTIHPGAIIQIDDYLNWQGSRLAIEESEWIKKFSKRLVGDALVLDSAGVG